MTTIEQFLDDIVSLAIGELRNEPTPVYTFAFYHDHESGAVSVCVDTKANSAEAVLRSNRWSIKYFDEHIQAGELEDAQLFQANAGRNLSLGDFAKINISRMDLPEGFEPCDDLYLGMVRSVMRHQEAILELSHDPDTVLFCSSTSDAEVGITWPRNPSAEQADGSNQIQR